MSSAISKNTKLLIWPVRQNHPADYVALDFWWGHHPFKVTRRDRNPYATPEQIEESDPLNVC